MFAIGQTQYHSKSVRAADSDLLQKLATSTVSHVKRAKSQSVKSDPWTRRKAERVARLNHVSSIPMGQAKVFYYTGWPYMVQAGYIWKMHVQSRPTNNVITEMFEGISKPFHG